VTKILANTTHLQIVSQAQQFPYEANVLKDNGNISGPAYHPTILNTQPANQVTAFLSYSMHAAPPLCWGAEVSFLTNLPLKMLIMSSKSAVILAFVGGALLIIAGVTGSVGIVGKAIEYLIDQLGGPTADILSIVLQALNFIADLGGVAVIFGGVLIYMERKRVAKFVIGIGAGMGLIGFLITLISALFHGWAYTLAFLFFIFQSLGWIGVILSIAATLLAK
jgi:hypothetical protein